jgi:hypothetical protein
MVCGLVNASPALRHIVVLAAINSTSMNTPEKRGGPKTPSR